MALLIVAILTFGISFSAPESNAEMFESIPAEMDTQEFADKICGGESLVIEKGAKDGKLKEVRFECL